jgi:site-specific recombinase XerD
MAKTMLVYAPTVSELQVSFVRSLKADNKSPATISIYGNAVGYFVRFLDHMGMPREIAVLTREHVEAFIIDVLERRKPATAHAYYRALQQFFKYAEAEGEVPSNPMARMKPPMVPEEIIPVPTDDQLRALFKACEGVGFASRRDSALLRLLLDAGLRRAEAAGLTMDDVDLEQNRVRVLGKGRRPRVVPFGDQTARALDRYTRIRWTHPKAKEEGFWLGHQGPLTAHGLHFIIKRRCKEAGISEMFLHQMRHGWADRLLSADMSETEVMRLAGWKSRAMVARYASARADERAYESYRRRKSPGDSL